VVHVVINHFRLRDPVTDATVGAVVTTRLGA